MWCCARYAQKFQVFNETSSWNETEIKSQDSKILLIYIHMHVKYILRMIHSQTTAFSWEILQDTIAHVACWLGIRVFFLSALRTHLYNRNTTNIVSKTLLWIPNAEVIMICKLHTLWKRGWMLNKVSFVLTNHFLFLEINRERGSYFLGVCHGLKHTWCTMLCVFMYAYYATL